MTQPWDIYEISQNNPYLLQESGFQMWLGDSRSTQWALPAAAATESTPTRDSEQQLVVTRHSKRQRGPASTSASELRISVGRRPAAAAAGLGTVTVALTVVVTGVTVTVTGGHLEPWYPKIS